MEPLQSAGISATAPDLSAFVAGAYGAAFIVLGVMLAAALLIARRARQAAKRQGL